jgi:hypothetical protein
MLDFLAIDALVNGILASDNTTKQQLGQKFAAYLGLQPGPSGGDTGIDGFGEINGQRIYFQAKLENKLLDASRAAEFYGNLMLHRSQVGILLSGKGYTQGFMQRLELDPELHQRFNIHLLSLADLWGQTPKWESAVIDLPPLRSLTTVDWRTVLDG